MKYFLDTEFDGHGGKLLSIALVREDEVSRYLIVESEATDPWVIENVVPLLDRHNAPRSYRVSDSDVGAFLRDFLGADTDPVIISDSAVDITYFTRAITTDSYGRWNPLGYPKMTFEVHNVDCYPTELEGAVQHNSWWDAMTLRHLLNK